MNTIKQLEVTKFYALDSIRGIAAVNVILQHFWEMNHPSDARYKPWLFFCAGHEAVILFFILSGFVLSHQLRNFKLTNYLQFVVRRFFRIYPLYYFSLILAAILFIYFKPNNHLYNQLSNWFRIWNLTHFDVALLINSVTLISHQGNSLNVAVWTLFYEMWISLIIPFVLIGLFKTKIWFKIATFLSLAIITYLIDKKVTLLASDWGGIVYYLWYFIIGMTLYCYRAYLSKLSSNWYLWLGIVIYYSNYLLMGKITSRLIQEICAAIGSSLILINCLYNVQLQKVLELKLFNYYGKISYSIYLLHLPVLYALTYWLINAQTLTMIKLYTFIFVSMLSYFSYQLIELKFIQLGKKLTGLN